MAAFCNWRSTLALALAAHFMSLTERAISLRANRVMTLVGADVPVQEQTRILDALGFAPRAVEGIGHLHHNAMRMPRACAMSLMFSTTTIGRLRRRNSSASRRDSRRFVASRTLTINSGGASPAKRPETTSRVTASSSVVAARL